MGNQLKTKLIMFKRWLYILSGRSNTAIKQDEGRFYRKEQIAGYYNNLMGKVNDETPVDSNGIPLTQIGDNEFVHFPIAIFQYGLGSYDCYLATGAAKHLEALKNIADWGVEHQDGNGAWDCFGPLKSSRYTVSSMGQGEGASLLLRAYTEFGDDRYLAAAKKAVDFMLLDMSNGGTAIRKNGSLYLEEYPQAPQRSVMNGWIFSLFGIYDLSLVDKSYNAPFELSSRTLSAAVDSYDNGYWSLYDLEKRIASPAYHTLHIALLNVMYDLTGDIVFKNKAEQFKDYENKRLNKLRAVLKKLAQKLTEKSEMVVMK